MPFWKKKKNELQLKCADLEKIVYKFCKGEVTLHKFLSAQKVSFNKEGIGFHPFNKNKSYNEFFVTSTNYKNSCSISCNYCKRLIIFLRIALLKEMFIVLCKSRCQKGQDHQILYIVTPMNLISSNMIWERFKLFCRTVHINN